MKKQTIKLNESQLHRLIKESVKKALNENYDLEDSIVSTLTEIRDGINTFLTNYESGYKGDYQMNIESDEFEYQRCLGALKGAFDEFKNLCSSDWDNYDV